jgi:hypothetical protein
MVAVQPGDTTSLCKVGETLGWPLNVQIELKSCQELSSEFEQREHQHEPGIRARGPAVPVGNQEQLPLSL